VAPERRGLAKVPQRPQGNGPLTWHLPLAPGEMGQNIFVIWHFCEVTRISGFFFNSVYG